MASSWPNVVEGYFRGETLVRTVDDLVSSGNGARFTPGMESNEGVEIPLTESGQCPPKAHWKKWNTWRRKGFGIMERPIGIEPTPEPWQGSVLPLY
jgi:hypothetical protein